MSVQPKIRVEENKDSIYLFDVTGKFSEKCNKTGWGSPNSRITSATSAKIHVYAPKQTVPVILDVYPDFPNEDNVGYEILPADIAQTKIVSGIWRFDYFVTVATSDGETFLAASCQMLFTKDVKCCTDKSTIEVNTENYNDPEVLKSNARQLLLKSAADNACLGNRKEAQKIIDHLYTKCKCKC